MVPPRHMLHGSLQPVRSSLRNLCAALGPQEAARLFSSPTLHADSSETASPEKVLSCLLNRVADAVSRLKLGLADAVVHLQPTSEPSWPGQQSGQVLQQRSRPRRARRGRQALSTAAAASENLTTPSAGCGLLVQAAVSSGSSKVSKDPSPPSQVQQQVEQLSLNRAATAEEKPVYQPSHRAQQPARGGQQQCLPPLAAMAAGGFAPSAVNTECDGAVPREPTSAPGPSSSSNSSSSSIGSALCVVIRRGA
jgi:hypothetical protein